MTATTTTGRAIINFETQACGRCGGSGTHLFNQRDGRRCWGCDGSGKRFTRRGYTARQAYNTLREERLSVPATDIVPGDRIFSPAHSAATIFGGQHKQMVRTVAEVKTQETQIVVVFTATDRSWSFPLDGRTYKITDTDTYSEAQLALMQEIARRFKGAWMDGEEPPAPLQPKPRAPRKKTEPKPRPVTPATDAQMKLLRETAEKLEQGELRSAARAMAAEAGKREVSAMIDRVLDALREQEDKKREGETSWVGEVGDRVTVAGSVTRLRVVDGGWGSSMLVVVSGTGEQEGVTVSFSSASSAAWGLEEGDAITVKATVKAQTTYRGAKETRLSRPRFTVG